MGYKHGHSRKDKTTSTYIVWRNMKSRYDNFNHPQYKYWGNRGIYVKDYFRGPDGFQNFLDYVGERPDDKSIDRYPKGNNGKITEIAKINAGFTVMVRTMK